jgi:hypothetical protein
MDSPYGCRSLHGENTKPKKDDDFHEKDYNSLPWPPRDLDSNHPNLSQLEDESPTKDVPWTWADCAKKPTQKDTFRIERYYDSTPSNVDSTPQVKQSLHNIPLDPDLNPQPPSKILEYSSRKFKDCDASLGPSAVLSDAPELWLSNFLDSHQLVQTPLELDSDLTEKLNLHSGEPLPKLCYLSIHQVLKAFEDKLSSEDRKPWKALRDVRCYYWEFLKKSQLMNNKNFDAEAYEKILISQKTDLEQQMAAAGAEYHAVFKAELIDLLKRLQRAQDSADELREIMKAFDDKLVVLSEELREVKIAAINSSSPPFLDAYFKASGHTIPREYLQMRAKGASTIGSAFRDYLMRPVALSQRLHQRLQLSAEAQQSQDQSTRPETLPFRSRITPASSHQIQGDPMQNEEFPESRFQPADLQALPFRPRITPASNQISSGRRQALLASPQFSSARPYIVSARHQTISANHQTARRSNQILSGHYQTLPADSQIPSASPRVVSACHQIIPAHHRISSASPEIMSSRPQTTPVFRHIMAGTSQTTPARQQVPPYRHRITPTNSSVFATNMTGLEGPTRDLTLDPSQSAETVDTNASNYYSDDSADSGEPVKKKKRGRPVKQYVPGAPMTDYMKRKLRREKAKLRAELSASNAVGPAVAGASIGPSASNARCTEEFNRLIAARAALSGPTPTPAAVSAAPAGAPGAEQSPALDPALRADDQAGALDQPSGKRTPSVTLRLGPRPDTEPGVSQAKRRRRC